MFGNSKPGPAPDLPEATERRRGTDPRVRFTREVLGDALLALMGERPFEDITIQDILNRAGVGRTTFYSHFSDKQDLFLSDVEEFLEGMASYLDRSQAPASRLAPVQELFAHLADITSLYKILAASGKLTEIRELGIGCFARSMERRLAAIPGAPLQPELRAPSHTLAGALFALLDWWMQEPTKMSPGEAEQLFHRWAWSGIKAGSVLTQAPIQL